MNVKKKAILLLGTPKKVQSTSDFTGGTLIRFLDKKGFQTEKLHMLTLLQDNEGLNKMLSSIDNAEIVIFSCPIYIDIMPHWVIQTMQLIVEHRKAMTRTKKQNFLVISNCGYPEAHHNNVALLIYRRFAKEAGFNWVGGLACGMGAALCGKVSKKFSFIFTNIKKALWVTANALAMDKPLPLEASELMAKPFAPKWFYIYITTTVGFFIIIKNKAWNIWRRPYIET